MRLGVAKLHPVLFLNPNLCGDVFKSGSIKGSKHNSKNLDRPTTLQVKMVIIRKSSTDADRVRC